MLAEGKVGLRALGDGAQAEFRLDRTGALVTQDAHAHYLEAAMRGNLYSTGPAVVMTLAATHAIATLGATCTPIVGLWNPLSSNVWAVVMKAKLALASAGNSAAPTGCFFWATNTQQNAISTGLNPLNRKTLNQAGSQCKGFANVALTGMTTNLVVQGSASFGGTIAAQGATASPLVAGEGVEEFEGGFLIPPGGVLALLSSSTASITTAASMLLWEEIPYVVGV